MMNVLPTQYFRDWVGHQVVPTSRQHPGGAQTRRGRLGEVERSHPVMNVLGHDVRTASQSDVRTPRCDAHHVQSVRTVQ